jgi:hypothetical protein
MYENEVASEASVLFTGFPLDVVEISEKHLHDGSRWNTWIEVTFWIVNVTSVTQRIHRAQDSLK